MIRSAAALGNAPPLVTVCETDGCGRNPVYVVFLDGLRKYVCRKCMPELVALWGWKLVLER